MKSPLCLQIKIPFQKNLINNYDFFYSFNKVASDQNDDQHYDAAATKKKTISKQNKTTNRQQKQKC